MGKKNLKIGKKRGALHTLHTYLSGCSRYVIKIRKLHGHGKIWLRWNKEWSES